MSWRQPFLISTEAAEEDAHLQNLLLNCSNLIRFDRIHAGSIIKRRRTGTQACSVVAGGMNSQLLLSILLCLIAPTLSQESLDATIVVNGSHLLAETANSFICATLDWWPPEKCNYNQCPWEHSSILNLDLTHPFLAKAIGAFSPLRIRVGGSLQDQVVYGVPNLGHPCLPFSKMNGGLFGFSKGCLSMARWDELNRLFQKTGAIVTFGLNALRGRSRAHNGMWFGNWNSTNARAFVEYTISKGYKVDSWEFGNELSGKGIGASVSADQYAKDLIHLKALLKELYKDSHSQPLIVAPGGFYDQQWYSQLLQDSGLGIVNAMTHHIYNLGGGDDSHIESKITDPQYLSQITTTFRNLQLTIQQHGPWSTAWVGEAGGAFNSGSRAVSNKFLNSFWYLDQLGMASKYNTKVYCRQTLIGGNYGLLNTDTFIPNPDYYSALLWHRLMGKGVFAVDVRGSPYLRAYAHCTKGKGGVSLLLINLSKSTRFTVAVHSDLNVVLAGGQEDGSVIDDIERVSFPAPAGNEKASGGASESREEYHLTGKDGNHLSQTVLLNGAPLQLTAEGDIPQLNPVRVQVRSPISVAPLSIAFVVFPSFEAPACRR